MNWPVPIAPLHCDRERNLFSMTKILSPVLMLWPLYSFHNKYLRDDAMRKDFAHLQIFLNIQKRIWYKLNKKVYPS